jgi:putative membrane protein
MKSHACPLIVLFAFVLAFGSAGCGKSGVQAARECDLTPQKILSIDDQKFLADAEKAEIRQNTFAQLAQQRSKNADIQAFATKVASDMSVASTELNDLMKAKHMPEPAAFAEATHSDAAVHLQSVSDDAFDREFISMMTVEGQEAVRLFDPAAETAADPDVRNYAKRVLPSLRADYDKASELEQKLAE